MERERDCERGWGTLKTTLQQNIPMQNIACSRATRVCVIRAISCCCCSLCFLFVFVVIRLRWYISKCVRDCDTARFINAMQWLLEFGGSSDI